MKMSFNSIQVFLLALCALLFALSTFAEHHQKDDFDKAWIKADKLRSQAASIGSEWRDVDKILLEASQAHKKGDIQKAMMLVKQAKSQSEASIVQQKRETELWRSRVLK